MKDLTDIEFSAGLEQAKPRKEKEPKKRKSKAIVPPVPAVPITTCSISSAPNTSTSTSTVILSPIAVFGNTQTSSIDGPSGCITVTTNVSTARKKAPRSGGIRGAADSRAVQAAALNRTLDCLNKDTVLASAKGKFHPDRQLSLHHRRLRLDCFDFEMSTEMNEWGFKNANLC